MGNWIREGRDRLGLSQEQLAAKIGINRTTLARMENGWKVSDVLMDKLREAFSEDGRVWIDGSWIRAGRERLGITQDNLADIVGVDRSVISRKEAGEIPSAELEVKIREALDERLSVPEDHKDGLKSRLESMAGEYGRSKRRRRGSKSSRPPSSRRVRRSSSWRMLTKRLISPGGTFSRTIKLC